MRTTLLGLAITLAAVIATPAFSAGTSSSKATNSQQSKMATCSTQSKGMKGDAHKTYMRNCLKNGPDAASASSAAMPNNKMTQQQKMSSCATKSKGLKGTEHKAFMSNCLKG